MNKRGVELSLNVIIVAIILLLVLGVVVYIFSDQIGGFVDSAGDCEKYSAGGKYSVSSKTSCSTGEINLGPGKGDEICCGTLIS